MFKKLSAHREELKENWANGGYTASFETEMIARNAAATGACSIIHDVLNYDSDDLEIEE